MTDEQKRILDLAIADLENGINTEWATFVIALIKASEESDE